MTNSINNPKVGSLVKINKDNQVITNSRILAAFFGKKHSHVLRDIQTLDISTDFRESNFGLSSFHSGNRDYPMYEITYDGFTLLALGFTGKKAMEFKVKYIKAFRAMERKLRELAVVPLTVDMKAISSVVKRGVSMAIKRELSKVFNNPSIPDLVRSYEPLSDEDMLRCLRNWYLHHHHQAVREQQSLFEENGLLRSKLDTIRKEILKP